MRRSVFLFIIVLLCSVSLLSETVSDIDDRAQRFYSEKRFSEAIREWLSALEIDPTNEKIQQKVEMVYEEKHRKNMAAQRSRIQMRETRQEVEKDSADLLEKKKDEAVSNFVLAYRIDPNDPEMKTLREKMEKFEHEIDAAIEKKRRSEADKRRYAVAVVDAQKAMDESRYADALERWDDALDLFNDDPVAKEGKRKAELAISNRLKFEKIKALLAHGSELFLLKQYDDALVEYRQVLLLDPKNDEADSYVGKIEDIVDAQQSQERKRQQAEQFYLAGIEDINRYRFNEARDNFENALDLIPKYKDAEARILSLKRLREEYGDRMRQQKLREIEKETAAGLFFYSQGNYKDALSSFERTLTMDPKNSLALDYLEKTKDALKEQQDEEVDESSAYYDLVQSLIVSGKALYMKGDFAGSRSRWEKIRNLFPNNRLAIEYILRCDQKLDPEKFKRFAELIVQNGTDALAAKNQKKALSIFQMIKVISPEYPGINELIAKSQTVRVVRKTTAAGVEVSAADIERRYQQGLDLYKLGGEKNLRSALEQFKWIVGVDPDNMKAAINMSKIESQIRIGAAGAETEAPGPRLTENQKRLVREYYLRGINYYSNNNFEKAIEEWRKVIALDPGNEKAKNNIRKCLALLKK